MHPYVNIAVRAARKAAKVILQAAAKKEFEIRQKGPHDFVTEVDLLADQIIVDTLHQAYPKHSFLTEESGNITHADKDALWIIDPIDGTNNFIHGFPNFVISIAYAEYGQLQHGVVYHPLTDELFSATRGQGAQLNGKRIRISPKAKLDDALFSCNLPRDKERLEKYFKLMRTLQPRVAGTRRLGATALDLAYVAAGYLDAYWNTGSNFWDIAAGVLLVREAGGTVTDDTGGVNFVEEQTLVAGNGKIVKELLLILKET